MKNQQLILGRVSGEFKDYWKESGRKVHGGVYSEGKRKTARPISTKKPIHLVMRSSRAKGALSMSAMQNLQQVDTIVHKYAERFGLKIYDYSNNGNHLHINIKTPSQSAFQKYLRTISGLIARAILKAKKGKAKGKFWDTLAFTRIADWGRSFTNLKKYIFRNVLEGAGIIPYDREGFRFISLERAAKNLESTA